MTVPEARALAGTYLEMLGAMGLGMLPLGLWWPDAGAVAWATAMALPVVAWTLLRGAPVRGAVDMAVVMYLAALLSPRLVDGDPMRAATTLQVLAAVAMLALLLLRPRLRRPPTDRPSAPYDPTRA